MVNHQLSSLFPPAPSLSSCQLGRDRVCPAATGCPVWRPSFFVLPHVKGQRSPIRHMCCHEHHVALWRRKTTNCHLRPYQLFGQGAPGFPLLFSLREYELSLGIGKIKRPKNCFHIGFVDGIRCKAAASFPRQSSAGMWGGMRKKHVRIPVPRTELRKSQRPHKEEEKHKHRKTRLVCKMTEQCVKKKL